MKKIWKYARDYKLRWILIVLGFPLAGEVHPVFLVMVWLGVMIILIDTGERFYRGLKGAEVIDER